MPNEEGASPTDCLDDANVLMVNVMGGGGRYFGRERVLVAMASILERE